MLNIESNFPILVSTPSSKMCWGGEGRRYLSFFLVFDDPQSSTTKINFFSYCTAVRRNKITIVAAEKKIGAKARAKAKKKANPFGGKDPNSAPNTALT